MVKGGRKTSTFEFWNPGKQRARSASTGSAAGAAGAVAITGSRRLNSNLYAARGNRVGIKTTDSLLAVLLLFIQLLHSRIRSVRVQGGSKRGG